MLRLDCIGHVGTVSKAKLTSEIYMLLVQMNGVHAHYVEVNIFLVLRLSRATNFCFDENIL